MVENLVNQTFGRLTVKRLSSTNPVVWECECSCGTVIPVTYTHTLKSGNTKSCGCLQREKAGDRLRLQPYEALYKRFKDSVKRHAKRHNKPPVEIVITFEQFLRSTAEIQCHYCLAEISWTKYNTNGRAAYNLDRKNSALGYTVDNVVVCCRRCNIGKGNQFTYDEWFLMTAPLRAINRKSLLDLAILLATAAHENQTDEDGQGHIVHSLAVMFAVKSVCDYRVAHRELLPYTVDELMIAAVLHDVVEDTHVTLDDIEALFGKNVRELVDCMTRRGLGKGETKEFYRDFIYRTRENAGAKLIKIADLTHNSGRAHLIKSASWRKKLEYKYRIALAVLQDIDEPTWEQASWESKTEGPHTLYFVADPNGKQIEITEDESKVMREEMKRKRFETLSRLTASNILETMAE